MTKRSHHRPERVATLIQETVAHALATSLKDPRVGFVTITGVTVSPDTSHATLRVSVMGSEEEKTKALEGLESARGFLRSRVAQSLSLRIAPELHFEIDRGLEHARRIDSILEQIKRDEPSD
ncbi:MAG TPA: 30S ribosome-binding factor RbfA [Gemmatimonadales bacterium]|jgi:ribosome-binding factor A|nr:30S ribosome-binding factor RbfA [Gemmatimonadales bacterium]